MNEEELDERDTGPFWLPVYFRALHATGWHGSWNDMLNLTWDEMAVIINAHWDQRDAAMEDELQRMLKR